MADLRPQQGEEVVGHGHPTKDDVTNRAWNVEHNEDGTHQMTDGVAGDIFYHNGISLVRLAKGPAGYVLQQNDALTAPQWRAKASDIAYAASWNGVTTIPPSKNAVYDQMETRAAKGANVDITSLAGLTTPLSVPQGGTGKATLTDHGVLLGSGAGAITALGVLTTGQLLMGQTGADPIAQGPFTDHRVLIGSGAGAISVSDAGLTGESLQGITGADPAFGSNLIAPSGTIMLFGQTAAPTGWTRKADWQNNAMLCYGSAGAIGSGGAVNPQSTHAHAFRTYAAAFAPDPGAPIGVITGKMFAPLGAGGGTFLWGDTVDVNTAPHYQEVIAAQKD